MLGKRMTTWALIALGALGAVMAGLSVGRAGIGWDAPIDVRAVAEIRAIPPGTPLDQAYEMVFWTSEFYGLLVTQLAEGAHALITGSSLPLDASMLATYRWHAGITIALAVLAAAALGWAVGRATRSALAGAFTWALTMTLPVYVGMSHVNFKDMPVAAGFTLVSAGLLLSRSALAPATRWVTAPVLAGVGATVALGTRVGSWPILLALLVGTLVIYLIVDGRRDSLRRTLPSLVTAGIAVVGPLIVLWLTNPFAHQNLPRWMFDSFVVMREYPMDLIVRVAGQDFATTDLPWWYVPAWLGAQLPVLTTVAVAFGLIASLASLARRSWSIERSSLATLAPIGLQGLVVPALIVLTGSVIYDGLRHVLFMLPALMAVAGVGVAALDRGAWRRPRAAAWTVIIGSLLVVLASAFATLRWLPYSYAFINPVAGSASSERAWELDYWGVTGAEGVRLLQEQGLNPVAVRPSLNTTELLGSVWPEQAREQAPDAYGLYVFHRWDESIGTCESLFIIERDGQVLGEGARCDKWDG